MSMPAVGRITSPGSTGAATTVPSRDSGFIVAADGPASGSGPSATGPTRRAAPVGASLMLALQETMTSETGDREARQHGQKLLAALAELQRALLSDGDGDGDALGKLLVLTTAMTHASDPELARTIHSIRLRARIELARLSPVIGEVSQPDPQA